uniref:Rho related BTB domain containing 3 n=1 Tax=Leptobrachium leishanense TaxID=445787 RepID=A0A8C5M0H3_9ANUR
MRLMMPRPGLDMAPSGGRPPAAPTERPAMQQSGHTQNSDQRSVHIVFLGDEQSRPCEDRERRTVAQFYLGGRATDVQIDSSHPMFTRYQARVFGNIHIVCHDCLRWDVFDSNQRSQYIIGEADIIILKYSVTDKSSYLEIKEKFAPLIKQKFLRRIVPVIVTAVGMPHNGGSLCTCPLCTSDREVCVTACEGNELAKDLAATFLELQDINEFYVGTYFGGMLEYFIRQSFKEKTVGKGKKSSVNKLCLVLKPPELEQPEKMPVLKEEPSQYACDLQGLLVSSRCVDVIFCRPDSGVTSAAHRIVLCSVSAVFSMLFSAKEQSGFEDSAVLKRTQNVFSLCIEDNVTAHNSSVRVIVKDLLLHSCFPDILHFIYSGAYQWDLLDQHVRRKLEDHGDVAHVLRRVRWLVKKPGKDQNPSDLAALKSRGPLNLPSVLGQFFNTPYLADVIFHVQGYAIPAHRAILVARCEIMAAMFTGNYMEAQSFQIPVYGVSKDTFLIFLEYLYSDSCCPENILQALSLLVCSEMYQVPRLQHMCESYIICQLQGMSSRELSASSLNVVHMLRKAKFHNSECLSVWLLYFIATNYLNFSQKKEFQDLTAEERAFIEKHRWPSSGYLKKLAEYRQYIHSQNSRCSIV